MCSCVTHPTTLLSQIAIETIRPVGHSLISHRSFYLYSMPFPFVVWVFRFRSSFLLLLPLFFLTFLCLRLSYYCYAYLIFRDRQKKCQLTCKNAFFHAFLSRIPPSKNSFTKKKKKKKNIHENKISIIFELAWKIFAANFVMPSKYFHGCNNEMHLTSKIKPSFCSFFSVYLIHLLISHSWTCRMTECIMLLWCHSQMFSGSNSEQKNRNEMND